MYWRCWFSIFRLPEPMVKRIIYQTLLAVNFCHQYNVSKLLLFHVWCVCVCVCVCVCFGGFCFLLLIILPTSPNQLNTTKTLLFFVVVFWHGSMDCSCCSWNVSTEVRISSFSVHERKCSVAIVFWSQKSILYLSCTCERVCISWESVRIFCRWQTSALLGVMMNWRYRKDMSF